MLNVISFNSICKYVITFILIFTSRWQKCSTPSLFVSLSARMESEVSGIYLQPPNCRGVGVERDSGYDSLRRRMSVLDRLTQTHPVWLLLAVSGEEASHILLKQPPGVRGYHPRTQMPPFNIT